MIQEVYVHGRWHHCESEMMYTPATFLTPEILAEILAEFSWPSFKEVSA